MPKNATLIFDIGKTNKKYYLFDEQLEVIQSEYIQFPEKPDDDFFPGDDLESISSWMLNTFSQLRQSHEYSIQHINYATYGATMVHLDHLGKPCTPLYNYLKPLPGDVLDFFSSRHGDIGSWSKQTASPCLGMLNTGLQLFWIKYKKPALFKNIRHSLFLPQYFSYLFTRQFVTEFTSLGCHTGMWDFGANDYHKWVYEEGLAGLLPPLQSTYQRYPIAENGITAGVGIHDSSAALVPYFQKSAEPFMLLSTGTWSICLNPYNHSPLTESELHQDCLCYLQPGGQPVKASRFFMGNIFSRWVLQFDRHFDVAETYHQSIRFSLQLFEKAAGEDSSFFMNVNDGQVRFREESIAHLSRFVDYEEAYHHLVVALANIQVDKIQLVAGDQPVRKIFVDGGFAGNAVFLESLAALLPHVELIPSGSPLGSSLGAAMMVRHNES